MSSSSLDVLDFDPYTSPQPAASVATDAIAGEVVRHRALQVLGNDFGPMLFDAWGKARGALPLQLKEFTFEYFGSYFTRDVYFSSEAIVWDAPSSSFTVEAEDVIKDAAVYFQSKEYVRCEPLSSAFVVIGFWFQNKSPSVNMRVGLFDGLSGLFFEQGGVSDFAFVHRIGGVDTRHVKSLWNIDHLDGSGVSEKTIDISTIQFMVIDFNWFGRSRIGFIIDGVIRWAHYIDRNNNYRTFGETMTLPVRFDMINSDPTDQTHQLKALFAAVYSESCFRPVRRESFSASTGQVTVTSTNRHPLISVRQKSTYNSLMSFAATSRLKEIEVLVTGGDACIDLMVNSRSDSSTSGVGGGGFVSVDSASIMEQKSDYTGPGASGVVGYPPVPMRTFYVSAKTGRRIIRPGAYTIGVYRSATVMSTAIIARYLMLTGRKVSGSPVCTAKLTWEEIK